MRAVKAKALRRALGFKPGEAREYDHQRPQQKVRLGLNGMPERYVVTGTITCKGVRGQYQKVKSARVLTEAVLRAAVMEAAHA